MKSKLKELKDLLIVSFFMYLVYFENVSHITFKWYKYIFFTLCSFIHEIINLWIWNHSLCYEGPFAYAKDLLTCAKKSHKIWTCFLLFKLSPNAFKFYMSSNILHKKWAMCLFIPKYFYMLVLKPFYMTS